MRFVIEDLLPDDLVVVPDFLVYVNHWRRHCAGLSPPQVERIDPFLVPRLASNLLLIDVEEGPCFRYRLVGEEVRRRVGLPMVGRLHREIFPPGPYTDIIRAQLKAVVGNARPLYSEHDYLDREGRFQRRAIRVAMPYRCADGGRRILALQLFGDELLSVPLRPEGDVRQLNPFRVRRCGLLAGPAAARAGRVAHCHTRRAGA